MYEIAKIDRDLSLIGSSIDVASVTKAREIARSRLVGLYDNDVARGRSSIGSRGRKCDARFRIQTDVRVPLSIRLFSLSRGFRDSFIPRRAREPFSPSDATTMLRAVTPKCCPVFRGPGFSLPGSLPPLRTAFESPPLTDRLAPKICAYDRDYVLCPHRNISEIYI